MMTLTANANSAVKGPVNSGIGARASPVARWCGESNRIVKGLSKQEASDVKYAKIMLQLNNIYS